MTPSRRFVAAYWRTAPVSPEHTQTLDKELHSINPNQKVRLLDPIKRFAVQS